MDNIKNYEDLQISDAFMFVKVMRNSEICKQLLGYNRYIYTFENRCKELSGKVYTRNATPEELEAAFGKGEN